MIQKYLELRDYKLWLDGTVEVDPDKIQDLLLSGFQESDLAVPHLTKELEQYNRLSETKIQVKTELNFDKFDFDYKIPDSYKVINLRSYFFGLGYLKYGQELDQVVLDRIEAELLEIEKRKLQNFFRTLIYIIDTLKSNKIIYGVGRGSSCACYLLFLLDLHKVDCIKYEIPMGEFFKN